MTSSTFYAPNDYRSYLMHHGVKGMKWGVRRFQNEDGSLTAAGKARAASDGKGLAARTKIRVQGAVGKHLEYYRGIQNSKSAGGVIDNAIGFGAGASLNRNRAYTEKRLAEASRTKLGKHIHEVRSYNATQFAKYGDRVHNSKNGKAAVRNVLKDVPMKSIVGRDTTLGKEIVLSSLTGGMASVALDAIYLMDKASRK